MYDSNTRNLKITPMKCKQLDQQFYRYTTCTNSNLASIDSCEYHGGISPGLQLHYDYGHEYTNDKNRN